MKTLRRNNCSFGIYYGILLFGIRNVHGLEKVYLIVTNVPFWAKNITFYESNTKPDHLKVRLAIYNLLAIIGIPLLTLGFYLFTTLKVVFNILFFNIIHNLEGYPHWDDKFAGIQSIVVTVYAIVISWLYFFN